MRRKRTAAALTKILAYARVLARAIVAAEKRAAALVHARQAKALVMTQVEVHLIQRALAQFKGNRIKVRALIKALTRAIAEIKAAAR